MPEKMDQEEGIVRPTKTKSDLSAGADALLAMIPSDLRSLLTSMKSREMIRRDLDFFRLYQPKAGPAAGPTLAGPLLGAPQAVMALEKIIALGARRIWVLGWCGSLQPDLLIGDLIIPTGALIEEGTSGHYPIGEREPTTDGDLTRVLEKTLEATGRSCRKGAVWTTDAPYRETPSKVKAYQERGILAVEMEMSALMTVALYRHVKLTGLLIVSDELFGLKWRHGFAEPRFKQSCRVAGEALLEAAEAFQDR